MEQSYQEQMYEKLPRQSLSAPCIFLCMILFIVLGIVPIVPDRAITVLKPVFILLCLMFKDRGYYRAGFEKWLIVLLGYLFLIWVTNLDIYRSISSYASMLLFAVFYFFAGLRKWNALEIRTILKTVIAAGCICACITFFSNGGSFVASGSQHVNYLFRATNRNSIAFSVAPGTVASAFLFFYDHKRMHFHIRYGVISLACYCSLIALSCRSAFLSATTGIFLIIWQATTEKADTVKRFFRRSFFLVSIYLALIIGMRILEGTNSARLFDYTSSGREDLWEESMELIHAKPVFGGGFDYWTRTGHLMSSHNTFFTVMLISGYIGGIFLGMMLVSMVMECLRARSIIALAFAMQVIFHSISEAGLDYYAYIPMILASLVLRYSEYTQKSVTSIFAPMNNKLRRRYFD